MHTYIHIVDCCLHVCSQAKDTYIHTYTHTHIHAYTYIHTYILWTAAYLPVAREIHLPYDGGDKEGITVYMYAYIYLMTAETKEASRFICMHTFTL